MCKYGVNWLRFCVGYLLLCIPLACWLNWIGDRVFATDPATQRTPPVLFWTGIAVAQIALGFTLARDKAKFKEQAAQAAESKPGVTLQRGNPLQTVSLPPLPWGKHFRTVFGSSSIAIGAVTLAAHLLVPGVSILQLLMVVLFVPLLITIGSYLVAHSNVEEAPSSLVTVPTTQVSDAVTPLAASAPVTTDADVVVVRGR